MKTLKGPAWLVLLPAIVVSSIPAQAGQRGEFDSADSRMPYAIGTLAGVGVAGAAAAVAESYENDHEIHNTDARLSKQDLGSSILKYSDKHQEIEDLVEQRKQGHLAHLSEPDFQAKLSQLRGELDLMDAKMTKSNNEYKQALAEMKASGRWVKGARVFSAASFLGAIYSLGRVAYPGAISPQAQPHKAVVSDHGIPLKRAGSQYDGAAHSTLPEGQESAPR